MSEWVDNYTLISARAEIDNVSARLKEFAQDTRENLLQVEYRLRHSEDHYESIEEETREVIMPRIEFLFEKISGLERILDKLQKKYAPSLTGGVKGKIDYIAATAAAAAAAETP